MKIKSLWPNVDNHGRLEKGEKCSPMAQLKPLLPLHMGTP